MKRTLSATALFLLLLAGTLQAQDKSAEAKKHFEKCLSTQAAMAEMKKALPTREECALVFSGANADTYYNMIEGIKTQLATSSQAANETFVENNIESFTTEDVKAGKGNYAGGMKNIEDKLMPNIVFYKLELLREKGAQNGMVYKYWVYLNNRWVYFPKPWSAFKKG
jgi:hypothetical protein